jgi:Uma2 family endonuclease
VPSAPPTLTAPRRYRLSVEAYDRMIEAGVLPPDARIELLEGVLYEMPPMGRPHQAVLRVLLQVFASLAAERRLLVQMPIVLPDDSEPEPDLAVVAPGTALDKPVVDQVVLAIEVAERSRRLDLEQKGPLYQRAGLLETWVVDLREQRLVVFPREGGSVVYRRGQGVRLSPRAVPEVTVDLDALFAEAQP